MLCCADVGDRYQGVDWSHTSAQGCNRAWDPTGPGDYAYDGISLDPMEVSDVGKAFSHRLLVISHQ